MTNGGSRTKWSRLTRATTSGRSPRSHCPASPEARRSGLEKVPDHVHALVLREDHLGRMLLVDVADEAVVHGITDELLQAAGERSHKLGRDAELLVLLLADVSSAVVHCDPDPALIGLIRAAAVPQAADPHEHTALRHRRRKRVVVRLERVRRFVPFVAPR